MTHGTLATKVEKKPRAKQPPPTKTPGVPYSSHHHESTECVPFIRNYASARTHFDYVAKTQKPYKDSFSYPVGKRSLNNRKMTETSSGGIAFTYQDDHFCTYNPDGTVLAQAFRNQRSGGLDRMCMPDGVWQDQFNRTGPCLMLGFDNGVQEVRWFWNEARADNGNLLNVVRARRPVLIHNVDTQWVPVDGSSTEPFEWRSTDRSAALKVSKAAGLPDLVAVIKACNALAAELPQFIGELGYRLHKNYSAALALCEAGDFLGATAYLRRSDASRLWNSSTQTYTMAGGGKIVSTEFERIRTILYLREGVMVEHQAHSLTWAQHQTVESNLKRFGSIG